MAVILSRLGVVLAKTESYPGLDASPVAADAIEAFDPSVEIVTDSLERDAVAKRSLGNMAFANGAQYYKLTFSVEAKGTNKASLGNSAEPEKIDALLRACGFAVSYVAPSGDDANSGRIEYSRTESEEPCTIYMYIDGILHKLLGCVGNAVINQDNNALSMIEFEFWGLYQAPIASAIPVDVEDHFPETTTTQAFALKSPRWLRSPKLATLLDFGIEGSKYDQNPNISLSSALQGSDTIRATVVYDRTKDCMEADASGDSNWYRDRNKSWFSTFGEFPKTTIVALTDTDVKFYSGVDASLMATLSFGSNKWLATGLTYRHLEFYNGVLYISTSDGVYSVDFVADKFKRYKTDGCATSDINISQSSQDVTYGTPDADQDIIANDVNAVAARSRNDGVDIFAVATSDGLSIISPSEDTSYDYAETGTQNAVADVALTSQYVYWISQGDTSLTDHAFCIRSSNKPTADDTGVDFGTGSPSASHKELRHGGNASLTSAFGLGKGTFGSSGDNNFTAVDVFEGGSEAESGDDLLVIGTQNYGFFTVHIASSDYANTQYKICDQDEYSALMDEDCVMSVLHEETTVSSTLDDKSRENNDLTSNGSPGFIADPDSVFGQVADFDGSATKYYSLANSGSAGDNVRVTGAFSVSMWFRIDGGTTGRLFGKGDAQVGTGNNAYNALINAGKPRFQIVDDSAGACIDIEVSTAVVSADTWYHVAFTYDGGTTASAMKIYLDGVEQTVTDLSSGTFVAIEDVVDDFLLGGYTFNTTIATLDGKMHGFQFYNGKALSQSDVDRNLKDGLHREIGSNFLAGTSNDVNSIKMDSLKRAHVATANQFTAISTVTNSQEESFSKIASNISINETGGYKAFAKDPGLDIEYSGDAALDFHGYNHLSEFANVKADATAKYCGKGFTYNGSSQYHIQNYSSDFDFGTGNFSFVGLFKHDSAASTDYIIDRRGSFDTDKTGFFVYMKTDGKLEASISDEDGNLDTATSTSSYDDDAWHSFAFVRDGSTLRLYVDGSEVATATVTNVTGSISGKFPKMMFGADREFTNFWEGELQAIMGSNVTMTAAEVLDFHAHYCGFIRKQTASINMNNGVVVRPNKCADSTGNVEGFKISSGTPTMSMAFTEEVLASDDWYSRVILNNPSRRHMVIQMNDDLPSNVNARMEVEVNYQPSSIARGDNNGVSQLTIESELIENLGDVRDQVKLIFK